MESWKEGSSNLMDLFWFCLVCPPKSFTLYDFFVGVCPTVRCTPNAHKYDILIFNEKKGGETILDIFRRILTSGQTRNKNNINILQSSRLDHSYLLEENIE